MSLTDDLLRIAVAAADEVSETAVAEPQHMEAEPSFDRDDYAEMGLPEAGMAPAPPSLPSPRDSLLSIIGEAFAPSADQAPADPSQPAEPPPAPMSVFDLGMSHEAEEDTGDTGAGWRDSYATSNAVRGLRDAMVPQDMNEFNRHVSSGEAMRLDPSGDRLRTTIRAMMRREA